MPPGLAEHALRITRERYAELYITVVNAALIDNKSDISPVRNMRLRLYGSNTVTPTDSAHLRQLNYIEDYSAVVAIPLQNALAPASG